MTTTVHPKYQVEWIQYENANFSPSKMKFSFPKANRFPKLQSLIHDKVSYDIPTTRHTRSTSFGFGKRFNQLNTNRGNVECS
jgi:hypothetical protein